MLLRPRKFYTHSVDIQNIYCISGQSLFLSISLENITKPSNLGMVPEKLLVFERFQGVLKNSIGIKFVNNPCWFTVMTLLKQFHYVK